VLLALSTPIAFILTVVRFSSPALKFPLLFCSMIFTLSLCGGYRTPGSQLWKLPLYLVMYVALAGLVAVLAAAFVMPTPSGMSRHAMHAVLPCCSPRSLQRFASLSSPARIPASSACAGMLARQQLAAALRGTGGVMQQAVDVASGPTDERGRLAAASGRAKGQLSIDEGLYPLIWPLHQKTCAAGTSCQVSREAGSRRRLLGAGRRCDSCVLSQRRLPSPTRLPLAGSWMSTDPPTCSPTSHSSSWECCPAPCSGGKALMTVAVAAVLRQARSIREGLRCDLYDSGSPRDPLCLICNVPRSSTGMLLYPLQCGTFNAAVCHRHRQELLGVAAAFQECCEALAATLESNAPLVAALQALGRLHAAFLRLGEAAAVSSAELRSDPSTMALHTLFALIFSSGARVRSGRFASVLDPSCTVRHVQSLPPCAAAQEGLQSAASCVGAGPAVRGRTDPGLL
jgi:hypothetical protein